MFVLPEREQILKRYTFPSETWNDCGDYWLNIAPQGSPAWHLNRKFRLTASNFGAAINKNNFSSAVVVAMDITNIKPKQFGSYGKFVMQHGVVTEHAARDWYCMTRNVKVVEVGLAVPKWEPRIGASLDGDVIGTNGVIEIKSPLQMYKPLSEHMDKLAGGWIQPEFYHNHIWESHYTQMQGGMKITNKKWCDYIVFATESNLCYVERIHFDHDYWDNTLWPGIQDFLDNIMEPIILDGQQSHVFQMLESISRNDMTN